MARVFIKVAENNLDKAIGELVECGFAVNRQKVVHPAASYGNVYLPAEHSEIPDEYHGHICNAMFTTDVDDPPVVTLKQVRTAGIGWEFTIDPRAIEARKREELRQRRREQQRRR